jgi:hypothetical protein
MLADRPDSAAVEVLRDLWGMAATPERIAIGTSRDTREQPLGADNDRVAAAPPVLIELDSVQAAPLGRRRVAD